MSFKSLLLNKFGQKSRTRIMVMVLSALAVISLIITYILIVLSGSVFSIDAREILTLIIIDLVLLLSIAVLVSKRLARLIAERKKGIAGSRLQTRVVFIASLMAVIPTIIVVVSSILFFNFGLQAWFDNKVGTAIDNSVAIAKSYLEEHKKIIKSDIIGTANDLNREAYNIRKNPSSFSKKLDVLAGIRKLPEAIVFQTKSKDNKRILANTRFSVALQMIMNDLPQSVMNQAKDGELVTYTTETEDRVIALIRLENYFDTYLLVARFVDDKILRYTELTQGAASQYQRLRADISHIQIQFYIVFLVGAIFLVFTAIWIGYLFAAQLVQPVAKLLEATEKVKHGDWHARVDIKGPKDDELVVLGQAFNEMAGQLENQRQELISAQRRSAWSDVARRIAHEIKNPLTPIQLAAERLRKKYGAFITDEKEHDKFDRYVNTISRNVGDIRQMAEEFANFARIPAPVFSECDIVSLLKDTIFSRKECSDHIVEYNSYIDLDKRIISCDEHQISRVLTNLLKNAEESVEDYLQKNGDKKGSIDVLYSEDDTSILITIKDSGVGFDNNLLHQITEPYVTTKSKGTGLGLAIVKKIVEDHKGKLTFANKDGGGAIVTLKLPVV